MLVRLLRHRQTNTVILHGERTVLVELDTHARRVPFKHLVKSVLDRLHDGLLLLTTHRLPIVLLDTERQRQTLQQVLTIRQDLQLLLTETTPLTASALAARTFLRRHLLDPSVLTITPTSTRCAFVGALAHKILYTTNLTLPQLPLRDSCELGLLKPRYKTHGPAASHIKQAIPDCRSVQLDTIELLG